MNHLPTFIASALPLIARTNWIEFLVPIVFVVIYAMSGIAKVFGESKKGKELKREHDSQNQTNKSSRYQSLQPNQPASQRPTHSAKTRNLPYAKQIQPIQAPTQTHAQPRQIDTMQQPTLIQEPAARPAPQPATRSVNTPRPSKPVYAKPDRTSQLQAQRRRAQQKLASQIEKNKKTVQRKPAPAKKQQSPQTTPIIEKDLTPSIRDGLKDKSSIRAAIIYSEIIAKPLALRDM